MFAMSKNKSRYQRGVTLIELVVVIVVVAVAASALLQGLGSQTVINVDPMIRSQAQLLARQFLQEVEQKSFFDPDADPRLDQSLSQADIIAFGVVPAAESASGYDRFSWDNVYDYQDFDSNNDDGLAAGVRDISGALIDGLGGYRVQISIDASPGLSEGSGFFYTSNVPNCVPRLQKILVTVTDPRGQGYTLSGYRMSLWDPATVNAAC